jgi:hypothetical protein
MALLSRTKSDGASLLGSYVAVPSFIISPQVDDSTRELTASLNTAYVSAVEEYQRKIDERQNLNSEYRDYDRGGSTTAAGIPYREGETDVAAEMAKRLKIRRDAAARAIAHNDKVRARQDAIEVEANQIAVRMKLLKETWNTVSIAVRDPLLFDAAAMLVTRSPGEQVLFLRVLTKGERFKFGNTGEYESADVRVLGALLDKGEKVELVK